MVYGPSTSLQQVFLQSPFLPPLPPRKVGKCKSSVRHGGAGRIVRRQENRREHPLDREWPLKGARHVEKAKEGMAAKAKAMPGPSSFSSPLH